ncbi:ATP-dependent nuclease [Streptomyces sp. NPDC017638]|uniref:ATP-dependent nuclease n=1 Tax=Streptomyces sp. NPDC017638 TaxID=3365004 RepID=UPI0037B55CF0
MRGIAVNMVAEPEGNPDEFSISIAGVDLASGTRVEFPKSGVTAIVGPNNSGKSTLLRQITAHVAQGPSARVRDKTFLVDGVQLQMSGTAADAVAWLKKHVVVTEDNGIAIYHGVRAGGIQEGNVLVRFREGINAGLQELNSLLVFYGDAWNRLNGASAVEQRDVFSSPPTAPMHVLQDDFMLFEELNQICEKVFGKSLTLDRLSKQVNLRVGRTGVPAPSVERVTEEYLAALSALPHLMEQGDGMKSMLGMLTPLLTSTYPVIFIDEPEAFLHPPQAAAVGKILGEQAKLRGAQIILATHDRNLLTGLLESDAEVSIVRLDRSASDVTRSHQLNARDLRDVWADPVLRYSNVLDGLFHRLVVLAEGDRDCHFYAAALEDAAASVGLPFSSGDVLFVPSGGKGGIPRLAKILRSVNVPVVASPDLDVLNNREMIKSIVESFGGDWSDLESDYNSATAAFRQPPDKVTVAQVLAALNGIFGERGSELFTSETRKEFAAQMRTKESMWSDLKDYGVLAFKGQAAQAAQRLLDKLDSIGVVAVRVGELEKFAPTLGVAKGPAWLPAAIGAGSHRDRDVRGHVMTLIAKANLD